MQSMTLFERIIVIKTKLISVISIKLGIGAGETWPGEIALTLRPNILSSLTAHIKKGIILVAGTNGKTTTSLMIATILEKHGDKVITNATGANLLNGVVSSLIRSSNWYGNVNADWGVFEVDENSLPLVLKYVKPKKIALLNLFRDQLDRYGEVDVIVEKWSKVLSAIEGQTSLILNADDPGIAWIGKKAKGNVSYFGVNDKKEYLKIAEHATDSTFCPNCGARLEYDGIFYSHIGHWHCKSCTFTRPTPNVSVFPSSLPGLYNLYNTLAAVAVTKSLGIPEHEIKKSLEHFTPAFGRQEEFVLNGKKVKIFLSKNPAGFNSSLRTVLELGAKNILLVLNDRIPDGRDVSWIWDVDFEVLAHDEHVMKKHGERMMIVVSGDRVYDLALRLQYAEVKNVAVEPDLKKAVALSNGDVYILATYSAMLEVRKILTGKKIL
jgi:lipid II isoglutaminyl synthase (glutamine-hydrolysing)